MKHLAGGLNPDHGIKVGAVYPDGTVRVYHSIKEGAPQRPLAFVKTFSTYGKARLWAQEYEENNRRMKMKEEPK